MVFLQKNHHAVRQLDALRLLRVESWKWRNWNLLPLLRVKWDEAEDANGNNEQ
jgi:hypothetical protein